MTTIFSPIDGLMTIFDNAVDDFYINEHSHSIGITIGGLYNPVKVKQLMLALGNCKGLYFKKREIMTISMIMMPEKASNLVIEHTDIERILQVLTNVYLYKNIKNMKQTASDRLEELFSHIFEYYNDNKDDYSSYQSILNNKIGKIKFIFNMSAKNFYKKSVQTNMLEAHRKVIKDLPLTTTMRNILDLDSLVPEYAADKEDHEAYDLIRDEQLENNAINNLVALNPREYNNLDEQEQRFYKNLYEHSLRDNDAGPSISRGTNRAIKQGRGRQYDEIQALGRSIFNRSKHILKQI